MSKRKQVKKGLNHQKSAAQDRFSYLVDEHKKLAIPVGPGFQADVPEWSGPPQRQYPHKTLTESDSSKWLGTVIWSNKHTSSETNRDVIGKGRPDHCDCHIPGSILCVNRHIAEKRAHIHKDLGPAFQTWKFDTMGEAVAQTWKIVEQQKFGRIVKEGNNSIKSALECFPSKPPRAILSYYFNVYLPRRISMQTRKGSTTVDTDDDEEEEKTACSNGSRKRAQDDGVVRTARF